MSCVGGHATINSGFNIGIAKSTDKGKTFKKLHLTIRGTEQQFTVFGTYSAELYGAAAVNFASGVLAAAEHGDPVRQHFVIELTVHVVSANPAASLLLKAATARADDAAAAGPATRPDANRRD